MFQAQAQAMAATMQGAAAATQGAQAADIALDAARMAEQAHRRLQETQAEAAQHAQWLKDEARRQLQAEREAALVAQRQAAAAEKASAHIHNQASIFAQQAQADLLRLQQEADDARAQGAELEAEKAELLLQRRAAAEAARDAEKHTRLEFERVRSAAEEAVRQSKTQADADVATIYNEA